MDLLKLLAGSCAVILLCALIAAGILAAVIFRLQRKAMAAMKNVGGIFDSVEALAEGSVYRDLPAAITLEALTVSRWRHPELVDAQRRQLLELGYVSQGCFLILPLRQCMEAFRQEQLHAWAVIYEHQAQDRPIVDVAMDYADGGALTCSNVELPERLDPPPGVAREYHPEADAAWLHRLLIKCSKGKAVAADEQSMPDYFERDYSRNMAFQLTIGALTPQRLRERMAERNVAVEGDDYALLVQQHQAQLGEFARQQLRRQVTMAQWEDLDFDSRLVIVHDLMSGSALDELFQKDGAEPTAGEKPAAPAKPDAAAHDSAGKTTFGAGAADSSAGLSAADSSGGAAAGDGRQRFASRNELLPLETRFQLFRTLLEPLPADIYLRPRPAGEEV